MRTWIMILGLTLTAAAQDAARPETLTLVERHVDVHLNENLGLLRVQFKVRNSTDRPLEGDVSFSTPAGGVVFGTSILKHIASTERKQKVLAPDHAVALYAADRARILEDALQDTFVMMRFIQGQTSDPVLLERADRDRFRLRFVPVPPRDNQTVTVWVAFEVPREGSTSTAIIPLRWETNFKTAVESKTTGALSLASADAVKTLACSSHLLGTARRDEEGRRFGAPIAGLADGREIRLSYTLGFWARLHDFTPGGTVRAALSTDEAAAWNALRAARALEAADESARPALASASGVVSAYSSFLVIPRQDARELARTAARELRAGPAPAAPASDEEARECEFVRVAMKLPARSWATRCEIHAVSTTDPNRIQWARDHGIPFGRSTGLLLGTSFDYVKHGAGCRVQEPNVEKLRRRAESLK